MLSLFVPAVLALALYGLPANGATAVAGKSLAIEPASTWAGIARVHLEIEDLRQTGLSLEGTYKIRIPLSPKRNDSGRVVLHASASLDESGRDVAITGSAVSATGEVHAVVARMQPDGVVLIRVATPDRTLRFRSRFLLR